MVFIRRILRRLYINVHVVCEGVALHAAATVAAARVTAVVQYTVAAIFAAL